MLLHQTFSDQIEHLKFVGYDRACDLHPMLNRLARTEVWAKQLTDGIDYFVDNFHVKKHVEKFCREDSPVVKYNLKHPKFADIKGVNSEICEQTFRWWNRFRSIIRNMTMARSIFLSFIIINRRNEYIDRVQRTAKVVS